MSIFAWLTVFLKKYNSQCCHNDEKCWSDSWNYDDFLKRQPWNNWQTMKRNYSSKIQHKASEYDYFSLSLAYWPRKPRRTRHDVTTLYNTKQINILPESRGHLNQISDQSRFNILHCLSCPWIAFHNKSNNIGGRSLGWYNNPPKGKSWRLVHLPIMLCERN